MVAVLRRKPWREVFTTYLPTILLIMTTYVTTFFKAQFFEAALGANLTTMLMMTTIFMTNLSELTETAYAKWIDVWLIFSQLVPFTEVILLTIKEAYRVEEKEVMSKTSQTTNQSWAAIVIQPNEGEADSTDVQEVDHQVMDKKLPASSRGAAKMLLYVKALDKTDKQSIRFMF